MSLITRCPACGTMFKVVTDQLKVSQGWVRCGRCAEVFDGTAHLLPEEAALPAPSALAPEDVAELGQTPAASGAQEWDAPAESASDLAEPAWAPARSFADRVPSESALSGQDDVQDSAAEFDPARWKRALLERQQHEVGFVPAHADSPGAATTDESDFEPSEVVDSEVPDSEVVHDVSFVRDARRKAFWGKSLTRWILGMLSLVLLGALALQWVIQQKDNLAALEPGFAPLLQSLCSRLRCEIRPPRHIESLVIDSSTFNKIGPDVYKLSFTLKNTGVMALEIPALEVTLTDTGDQALVRRVLVPAQFGAGAKSLAARSELAGVVTMKVLNNGGLAASSTPPSSTPEPPLRVAGYRILAFYP
ncbi:MAG: DUF3426 domain-containing protein [Polaromonas sp.]